VAEFARRRVDDAVWLATYTLLVGMPFVALLLGAIPPGISRPWDFAMAIGYAAVALFGMQFLLTARFKRPAAPFGIDLIYYFHRYLAIVAVVLALCHVIVLAPNRVQSISDAFALRNDFYMNAGAVALLLFIGITGSSIWRRHLAMGYRSWRIMHAALAVAGLFLMAAHVSGSGYYLQDHRRHAIWSAWILIWAALIIYVRVLRPLQVLRNPYRVCAVQTETETVTNLILEPLGHSGIAFEPGQFAWLTIRASPFAMRDHPFSIASSATNRQRIEFAIKRRGEFTRMIERLRAGELVYVDAPYGSFSIDRYPTARGFVFIAGGIGIAPILGMLRTMAARGEPRPIVLIYGNNLQSRIAHARTLEILSQQLALRIVHVLGEPPAEWRGERGLISEAIVSRHLPQDVAGYQVFICGPNSMKRSVERSLRNLRVPRHATHSEIFDIV
jgi:predicted ferric reductase